VFVRQGSVFNIINNYKYGTRGLPKPGNPELTMMIIQRNSLCQEINHWIREENAGEVEDGELAYLSLLRARPPYQMSYEKKILTVQ